MCCQWGDVHCPGCTSSLTAVAQVGDVFALLVEYYHSQQNMQQAYMLIEKMRGRNIILRCDHRSWRSP